MRVLMLSKACIVSQYQTKLKELAQKPGIELTVVVPPEWRDERGALKLERAPTDGYDLVVAPLRFNGHYHLHYYPTLPTILARAKPEIVHLDEEPYNLATYHALRQVQRITPRARTLFFAWQNLLRQYPPPFSWMEQYVYRHTDAAIAGSADARAVLCAKGFTKPIRIIPQFGVAETFYPMRPSRSDSRVIIGYAGRLVQEKGVALLLRALAQVHGEWELQIRGDGPQRGQLLALARELGISARIHFAPWTASSEMPHFYNSLDVLVVPSVSQPNWKEQFGRVIMEAMACGVPVVGSSSGEIPNVIGDAGMIFPEGDTTALANRLHMLIADPARRRTIAERGRARALEKFSQTRVVDDTYALYCDLIQSKTKF